VSSHVWDFGEVAIIFTSDNAKNLRIAVFCNNFLKQSEEKRIRLGPKNHA
jgi:hypothetical protein